MMCNLTSNCCLNFSLTLTTLKSGDRETIFLESKGVISRTERHEVLNARI